jgi:hypothetical protein
VAGTTVRSTGGGPLAGRPLLRWSWQGTDQHRWLTLLSTATLAAAAATALFGLPPLDVHGPLHYVGVMDPLCGGTRAARHTMRGEVALAWRYNPLGILAVVAAAVLVVRSAVGTATSRWLTVVVSWTPTRRKAALAVCGVLVAALAVRQQLRAELLVSGG